MKTVTDIALALFITCFLYLVGWCIASIWVAVPDHYDKLAKCCVIVIVASWLTIKMFHEEPKKPTE